MPLCVRACAPCSQPTYALPRSRAQPPEEGSCRRHQSSAAAGAVGHGQQHTGGLHTWQHQLPLPPQAALDLLGLPQVWAGAPLGCQSSGPPLIG